MKRDPDSFPKIDPARSAQMSLVRSRDTKPEMRVRQALHATGLRYRLHDRRLPGSPDLVFPSRRIVVFVHGCFWHRHEGCAAARMPKSRLEFWEPKLEGNVARDRKQRTALEALGWTVMVVWECETKDPMVLRSLAGRIRAHAVVKPARRAPSSRSRGGWEK
jgi:DNA mismatch endonuclease (patch repair protein)